MGKRFIALLMALAISLSFSGCETLRTSDKNGVFINGYLHAETKSAFIGNSIYYGFHSFRMYEDYYSESPYWLDPAVTLKVVITGYLGINWRTGGCLISREYIHTIVLYNLPSIGDLTIPLNNGIYEGGNELVSSVTINEYSFGGYFYYNYEFLERENSVDIHIVLTDKKRIDIRYSGITPHDGAY